MYKDKHGNDISITEAELRLDMSEMNLEIAAMGQAIVEILISCGLTTQEEYESKYEEVKNREKLKSVFDMLSDKRKELEEQQKKEDYYKENPGAALADLLSTFKDS